MVTGKSKNGGKRAKKRIVVVGVGRFGSQLARKLYDQGHDVLAIDTNAEAIQSIKGTVSYAVVGNAVSRETMAEIGVDEFDVGIVAIGGDEKASIMAAVLLKTFDIDVIARARNQLHAQTLELLGCERVIRVEDEMGIKVAETLDNPDFDHLRLDRNTVMAWIEAPRALVGKTLQDAGFSLRKGKPAKHSTRLLLLKHQGSKASLDWDPAEDATIGEGTWIAVAGELGEIERLRNQN